MMIKSIYQSSRHLLLSVLAISLVLSGVGCSLHSTQMTDELPDHSVVTTPSVDEAMAASTTHRDARRPITPSHLKSQDGSVSHGPLYFEDDDEAAFSEDHFSAKKTNEFLCMFVENSRFILNTVFYPISVLDTPHWSRMASDGIPSRMVFGVKQDAVRRE